jgi:proline iminopeptidase
MTSPNRSAGGAVDEGLFVAVSGREQWISVRGADTANPPLLILSGPGVAFSRMAPFFAPWERDFTLVQWDQPGGGATFARDGEMALTVDGLAQDAAQVAEVACQRLGTAKLVVLGVSGGSILGLKLAKARPDLVAVYVGTGQIAHWGRQSARGYRLALEAAHARSDSEGVAALERAGPPPYADLARDLVLSQYANAQTAAEQAEFTSLDPATAAALAAPPDGARYVPQGLALPDGRARGLAAYLALRDEIHAFDAWTLGLHYEVPMIFLQGDQDLYTPTEEVAALERDLAAPAKALALIEGGGHSAVFLRERFLAALRAHVRPLV